MDKDRKHGWVRAAVTFMAAGAALAFYHHRTNGAGGRLEPFVYGVAVLAAGWAGALVGGLYDWLKGRGTMLEPFFEGRFGWFYRRGFWFRFALVFSSAWLLFTALCVVVALAVGAYDEARTFFTPEGAAAVLLFVVVFWAEGALVGGVLDLARYLYRK